MPIPRIWDAIEFDDRPDDAVAREGWARNAEPVVAAHTYARRAYRMLWRQGNTAVNVARGQLLEVPLTAQAPGNFVQNLAGNPDGLGVGIRAYAIQVVEVQGRPFNSLPAAEQADGRSQDYEGVLSVPTNVTLALLGGATQALTLLDGAAFAAGQRAYRFRTGLGINHEAGVRDYSAIRGFLNFSVSIVGLTAGDILEFWAELGVNPLPAMDFTGLRLNVAA